MNKKFLAGMLAAICLLSAIPSVSAADVPTEEPSQLISNVDNPTEEPSQLIPTFDDPTEAAAAEEPDADLLSDTSTFAPTGILNPVAVIGAYPTANGVTLTWQPYDGAAGYYVFIKKPDGGLKAIGSTETTSFEHRLTPDNTTYTYTVRAVDGSGKYISSLDTEGFAFTCLPAPTLKSIVNVNGGQKISWDSTNGCAWYRVYIKDNNGWKAVIDTDKTSFLNTAVTSGMRYSYTVRCWSKNLRSPLSFYNRRGISSTYIAAPQISGFSPVKSGVSFRWNAVRGAVRYCAFVKQSGKWKILGCTEKTSFTHSFTPNGMTYFYAVRCIDKNGGFVSDFLTVNNSFRCLAAPKLTSLKNGALSWNSVTGAAGYLTYRKPYGKAWEPVAKTDSLSYTDTAYTKNTLYSYTVRCLDGSGRLVSFFNDNGLLYYNGNPADGRIKVGTSTLTFKDGKLRQGYVTVNGKTYYYDSKGVLQKNGLVGNKTDGFRFADKNGVVIFNYTGLASNASGTWYLKNGKLDRTLRDAVTVGSTDYVVIDGKAHPVRTAEERTLFRALKLANRVASRTLPKEQRLKILWDYIRDAYIEKNPRIPHYHGMDWPIIYANDMLVDGVGNCMSYGSEFAFLAKSIGYDEAYACQSGGHGWAEINGLVYDPEWSRHRFQYNYYGLSYNAKTDQDYKGAISAGLPWMRIKICPHL